MKKEHLDYLNDILGSIEKIEHFTKGMSSEDFKADERTSFAVIRALEIIGEAAKNVPESVRKSCPQIPWKDMAGMRDKLIHEYAGVDLDIIWHTVKADLPPLKEPLRNLIKKSSGKS